MDRVDDLPAGVAAGRTPRRIFLTHVARERLDHVAGLRDVLGRPPLALVAGYSFKTNPREELAQMARERGFWAEVISRDELEWAERQGFAPERTIYNGPEPVLDRAEGARLGVAFADSVEAFGRNLRRGVAHVHGVRLRPAMIASRFGVPLEDEPELVAEVAAAPSQTPLGVSFHARREDFHGASWRDVAGDVLQRAAKLEALTGRHVVAFDAGGGWTPEEFDAAFQSDMRWLVDRIVETLPSCTQLLFEPGQSVGTPTEALLTEVVEVRARRGRIDAVVDAGYPDWPEMNAYPHRMFAWSDGRWTPVGRGPDRLLGRTCLEYDHVDGLRFPPDLAAGDRLLIADTGSYDHAMSFDFARGGERDRTLPV
jgi:diaminopimelate decarboxylase